MTGNERKVEILANGYDQGPKDPYLFEGHVGFIVDIKRETEWDEPVYYIQFDDPRVNTWFGEPDDTTWPFFERELKFR